MTDFANKMCEIANEARDYLLNIKDTVKLQYPQEVAIMEGNTYDDETIIYTVKITEVNSSCAIDTEGEEHDVYDLEPLDVALLADAVSQIIEK